MKPLKFEKGLQSCAIKARKCPFTFFKYQTGPMRLRWSGAPVPPGLEFLHHILLRTLHGIIQEHILSHLLLPNLNLKKTPRHNHLPQKCGIPNWPGTRKRHFSLNCSSRRPPWSPEPTVGLLFPPPGPVLSPSRTSEGTNHKLSS